MKLITWIHTQELTQMTDYCTWTNYLPANNGVLGWLGSRVVSVLDSGAAQKGPDSNRSRDAVG